MARRFPDGTSDRTEISVQDFLDDCFGQGDPFASLEEGDTVEYTVGEDGNYEIFIYNVVYSFSPEEFEQLKIMAPNINFVEEQPDQLESLHIVYDKTGFREQTQPGKKGQTCPHCGGHHVVLHPNSEGVVMHCGKVNKPVARIMKSNADKQAENLVLQVLSKARAGGENGFGGEPGHEGEEKREVIIGNEMLAIITSLRSGSSESNENSLDKLEELAQELVDMHGGGMGDEVPHGDEDEVVNHSAIQSHCGICGSKRHQTSDCPKEGMPI